MRTTIKSISLKLALSTATVSRVLSERDGAAIAENTRRRVLEMANEMGYRPNRAARALATGKTHLVALALNHARSSYYVKVMHQTLDWLRAEGYDLMVSHMGEEGDGIDALGLSAWPFDGILAVDNSIDIDNHLRGSLLQQTPFVNMGAFLSPYADGVGVDMAHGATEAVRHLLAIGCRHIGYLAAAGEMEAGHSRYDAFISGVRQAGAEPETIVISQETRAAAREAVLAFFHSNGCLDGLFCFNDDLALGAYRALCDLRLRIPEDVALVGCDGIEEAEYLETPLTTIVLPVEQMCAHGWQLLKRRMEYRSAPLQQIYLKPQLEIRASSARR